jgi:ligand-binding sensor domain-containing protein
MSRRFTRALALGFAALSIVPSFPLSAHLCSQWRPDERALISDFSSVAAVAASPFLVFAATTHGLTIYDRLAREWRLPVTSLDGYPAARVRVALADPVGSAVWLGTDEGWARYDADVRLWESGFAAGGGGGVINLMLDAGDPASGVFVQSAAGWGFLPRGALVPIAGQPLPPPGRRIVPLTPESALALAPMADALRALILTDPRLRTFRFTCAARSPDWTDLFFGTNGIGMVRMDATTAEWQALPFGLVAVRAGGVAEGTGGVWVASRSRVGERRGLTWVAADLSAMSATEGSGAIGFGCLEGRRLLVDGSFLWLACERGLLKIEVGSYRSRLFDAGRGLPSDDVLSLAPASDGVWVGTTRGLAVVTRDDRVLPTGTLARPVLSLLAVRDSLWVGTTDGLGLLLPGSNEVGVPADVADQPALHTPILALARVRDTLVAVTADQFAWRDPVTHAWILMHARSDVGAITALVGDAGGGGVWIGGTAALAFWDLARASFRTLRVPVDIPAAVRDIAVDPQYVWVSTDSGLVRFTRSAALGR